MSSPVAYPQAIPSALFLVVPLLSIFLLYLALSRPFPSTLHGSRKSRVLSSLLAVVFLAMLSTVAGALGVALSLLQGKETRDFGLTVAKAVVVSVLNFALGACIVYMFTIAVPATIISSRKLFVHNTLFVILLLCATILSCLAPALAPVHIPQFIAPLFTLLATIFPVALFVAALVVSIKVTRRSSSSFSSAEKQHGTTRKLDRSRVKFWLLLASAQMSGVLAAIFGFLLHDAHVFTLTFKILHSLCMVVWVSGVVFALYTLSSYVTASSTFPSTRSSSSRRASTNSSGSTRSTNFQPTSSTSSDFLNLRDPFASPPPGSVTIPSFILATEKATPLGSEPANMQALFEVPPKRARRAKKKESAQTLLAPTPTSSAPTSPLAEDVDFGAEEAMLAQLLLHTLQIDYQPDFNVSLASPTRSGMDLGTEHPGASMTTLVPAKHASHRLTQVSTDTGAGATLYEPESPLTTAKPLCGMVEEAKGHEESAHET